MSVRRNKRTSGGEGEHGVVHLYEGPAVLTDLLARAGSPFRTEDVADRFRQAQAGGQDRSDAIPALFANEPRFTSPEAARRLYGNLFGLWDRVAAGLSIGDDLPDPTRVRPIAAPPPAVGSEAQAAEPRPTSLPLPARGAARGRQLSADVVEAVWKHLDALPEREQRRLRHRFESAQPDLVAWLDATPIGEAGAIAAQDLVFETWAMFDVAFGDRVGAVPFMELRASAAEPPPLETSQPALAGYVAEVLDLLAEEDASFGATDRAQVERLVATVVRGLDEHLEEE